MPVFFCPRTHTVPCQMPAALSCPCLEQTMDTLECFIFSHAPWPTGTSPALPSDPSFLSSCHTARPDPGPATLMCSLLGAFAPCQLMGALVSFCHPSLLAVYLQPNRTRDVPSLLTEDKARAFPPAAPETCMASSPLIPCILLQSLWKPVLHAGPAQCTCRPPSPPCRVAL